MKKKKKKKKKKKEGKMQNGDCLVLNIYYYV